MEDKDKCDTCIPARDTVCAGLVNLTELPEGGRGIVDRVS
ncbi:MAG: hypothetical protein IEMM0007_1647 [bacterium]|nr:MAG: hypothetical protein IEMM0007_1647 [bacterium]